MSGYVFILLWNGSYKIESGTHIPIDIVIINMEPYTITKTLTQVISQYDLEQTEDIKSALGANLKKDMEGIFIKEGYVVPDSLRVMDMSAGSVISESLSGDL